MIRNYLNIILTYLVLSKEPASCQEYSQGWNRPDEYFGGRYNRNYDRHGWGYFVITVPTVGNPYYQPVASDQADRSYYQFAQPQQGYRPYYPDVQQQQANGYYYPAAQTNQGLQYLPPTQPQEPQYTPVQSQGPQYLPPAQPQGLQYLQYISEATIFSTVQSQGLQYLPPAQSQGAQYFPVAQSQSKRPQTTVQAQFNAPSQTGTVQAAAMQTNDPFKELLDINVTASYDPNVDICMIPVPEKPNFRAPGRRISDTMCRDYVWQIRFRQDDENRIKCKSTRVTEDGTGIAAAIGGRVTEVGEFPHMGAIGWKAKMGTWIFKCGSSLISPRFVLTAAHCSSSIDRRVAERKPKIVRLGDKNIIDITIKNIPPKDVEIMDIIVHPNFAPPLRYYDVALMRLREEVSFTHLIQPACLWPNSETESLGTSATLTGWGEIESGSRKISPELQAATVDIINSAQCDDLLSPYCERRYWCGLQDHQICAGVLAGGVDACFGDSGGPLQVKIPLKSNNQGSLHYVIGVTSFGFGCALPDSPGVYSRVSSFIDWIEDQVWNR